MRLHPLDAEAWRRAKTVPTKIVLAHGTCFDRRVHRERIKFHSRFLRVVGREVHCVTLQYVFEARRGDLATGYRPSWV